jgi:hypothetical protein
VVAGGGINGLLLAFLAQNCGSSKLVGSFLKCVQLTGCKSMFGSMVVVIFQSVFYSEMYQNNNIFL